MIQWLNEDINPCFPPTTEALSDPNGLLAAGGALSPAWLLEAYRRGIFPWYGDDDPILWWSPSPRLVILPETFRLPHTVRKLIKRSSLHITFDQDFERVMTACAQPRPYADDTWINTDMLNAYSELHAQGFASSAEGWDEHGNLVGGLYGVRMGGVFFGESMFSSVDNASKLVFSEFATRAFAAGLSMIDCQMHTHHLAQFGGVELERAEFEQRLKHVHDPAFRLHANP